MPALCFRTLSLSHKAVSKIFLALEGDVISAFQSCSLGEYSGNNLEQKVVLIHL